MITAEHCLSRRTLLDSIPNHFALIHLAQPRKHSPPTNNPTEDASLASSCITADNNAFPAVNLRPTREYGAIHMLFGENQ